MKKTLLTLTAAACLFVGCGNTPILSVDTIQGNKEEIGGIHFRYAQGNQEINFYDQGFNGTLDVVKIIHPGSAIPTVSTPDSSDFAKYDSMYHKIREMATTGEIK